MNILKDSKDTIAAIATPIGEGGISVIRVSGERAFSIVDHLFHGNKKIVDCISHTIHFGTIIDPSSMETIDTVLVSIFRNPHSFTGEDIVEISSHGGYFLSQKILALLLSTGARPAEPGEFSLRAFMNAKFDLTQAEAIADIIHAKTEKAHKASVEQLEGKLSSYVQNIRTEILSVCSLLELELDFSQEGIELVDKSNVAVKLDTVINIIKKLTDSFYEGKLVRDGVRVALIGRPNSGKSSLLNILLEEERAIVSEVPGTTRDVIEESILIDGIEFIFSDTAGLRKAFDKIEQEGIRRTAIISERSDIILLLVDSSQVLSKTDSNIHQEILETFINKKPILIAINKLDIKHSEFSLPINDFPKNSQFVGLSCISHLGISRLKKALFELTVPKHDSTASSVTITNVRHRDALEKALSALLAARESINKGLSGDFIAVDLHLALDYLGEIIGLTTPDDILNNIFSKFCIGK
ncbi:MAG: tRNA uridine-5-carboxymethylaminomethyl(34) synthesis GTPase MnmE [Bacteroidota bacterium]|nr:tRNA uridine-5-carboxymethylaminomethyl(34) synthesis GTPase MnmE [Bacteroidota bacterium]